MAVGFAPKNPVNYPPYGGTPPINPPNMQPGAPDYLVNAIKEKAPLIAAILSTPAGCDLPQQGGISGTLNQPKLTPPGVCYLA